MENNQKRSKGTTALIVLLLLVTIAALILATFAWARYTSQTSGNAVANVAKWDVTFGSDDDKFVQTYKHVVNGEIAPGTAGSFDVYIYPGESQVCIDYSVTLDSITFDPATYTVNGSSKTSATEILKHLKFFSDQSYTNLLENGSVAFSGEIDLKNHTTTPATPYNDAILTEDSEGTTCLKKTIYWVWPYDKTDAETKYANSADAKATIESDAADYDAVDTEVGGNVNTMTAQFTIVANQTRPE